MKEGFKSILGKSWGVLVKPSISWLDLAVALFVALMIDYTGSYWWLLVLFVTSFKVSFKKGDRQ